MVLPTVGESSHLHFKSQDKSSQACLEAHLRVTLELIKLTVNTNQHRMKGEQDSAVKAA